MLLGIVVLVLSALFFYVLFNPQFGREEEIKDERVIPVTVGMGAGLGFYEGFLGPGTGSMLMAGSSRERVSEWIGPLPLEGSSISEGT